MRGFKLVPFSEARAGDVFFCHSRGFDSAFIRLMTVSRVNHAGIVISNGRDGVLCHEAEAKGYRPKHRSPHDQSIETVLRPPWEYDGDMSAALAVSHHMLGWKYDWLALWWLFVRQMTGHRISRNRRRPGRVFCSQAVARCMEGGGFELGEPYDADPASLRERLLTYPDVPPSVR